MSIPIFNRLQLISVNGKEFRIDARSANGVMLLKRNDGDSYIVTSELLAKHCDKKEIFERVNRLVRFEYQYPNNSYLVWMNEAEYQGRNTPPEYRDAIDSDGIYIDRVTGAAIYLDVVEAIVKEVQR